MKLNGFQLMLALVLVGLVSQPTTQITLGAQPTSLVGGERAEDSLTLTGCLLLTRRADVYALHMEFNRIAVIDHADLPNHVGHWVTLLGEFEERGDQLRFLVEEIRHVRPTCEVQASVAAPTAHRA